MGRPARSATRRPVLLLRPAAPRLPDPRPTVDVAGLLQAAVSFHQAGNAAEAEQRYRQVLAVDPEQPDALHLLGVLAFQLGRADVAVPLIERAVGHRPAASPYRLNLGSALLALGRPDEAVAQYQAAAALAPNDPEAPYNLGNALIQRGDVQEGVAALRRAIALRPDHLGAQYNLGNALREAGHLDEALVAYTAALRIEPGHVDAQTNLGAVLHTLGRPDEARACFERALALAPDHLIALVNLAETLRQLDLLDEAAPHYERVLALAPDHLVGLRGLTAIHQTRQRHAEAAVLLGRIVAISPDDPNAHLHYSRELHAAGQPEQACQAILAGLEHLPGDLPLARRLVDQLGHLTDYPTGPTLRAALLSLCADDTYNAQDMADPIAQILVSDPAFVRLVLTARSGVEALVADLQLPESLVSEPVVLAALARIVICAPDLERSLTLLRRYALLRTGSSAAGAWPPLPAPFLCALARAAFLVEHAWLVQPDESECLETVRAELVGLLADPNTGIADLVAAEDRLLLYALYDRLWSLPGAERMLAVPDDQWSPDFVAVIREQVTEPLEERALAASLTQLTPIDDAISQAVQAMYEVNPYPRWRTASFHGTEVLAERVRLLCPDEPPPDWPSPLPVLIAGAGTGQHPIQTALRLPDAEILAVDLSRTSLAYGARMAATIGVPNLTLAQADILALDSLDIPHGQFALIECEGVLHHMDDPLAGWAVLRRLLRPDGLMLIGLYSELGRREIVAAREMIAEEAIPSTSDGIRAARRRILDLPVDDPIFGITRFRDFYSESGFRDLAMHVQEHRFTIPRLAAALDAMDLRFLGFQTSKAVWEQFRARFPSPDAGRDLACWDQFEEDHPATFASMYHIWCRPR